jgi:hypothetical protein
MNKLEKVLEQVTPLTLEQAVLQKQSRRTEVAKLLSSKRTKYSELQEHIDQYNSMSRRDRRAGNGLKWIAEAEQQTGVLIQTIQLLTSVLETIVGDE